MFKPTESLFNTVLNCYYSEMEKHGVGTTFRFGQWFLNKYYPNIADPELFYEEDHNTAIVMAYNKYVKGN